MRTAAILNRDGGTLRTLDVEAFAETLLERLREAGHDAEAIIVDGDELIPALDEATARDDLDAVIAGGGDGTISAAAARLMNTGKALGVLPAGTMNLFARSLAIPLDLATAAEALAKAGLRDVDVATANDTVFIHQFTIGMHPKLIKLRERRSFSSRLGKMRASLQAAIGALTRPPRIRMRLEIDGKARTVSTSSLGISNNLFGEGHLPYTDTPDGGVLGVYITRARTGRDIAKFVLNMAIGRWRANDQVEIVTAREVKVELTSSHARFGCAMDGELCDLERKTTVRIMPGALKVLAPASSAT
jgi:diacylglycerol kinase family enzyme